jgi:hypothetical protein
VTPPSNYSYPIYPHKRVERWNAPSIEVARRWADEARARGDSASVGVQYNSQEAQYFTEVWITVERPA